MKNKRLNIETFVIPGEGRYNPSEIETPDSTERDWNDFEVQENEEDFVSPVEVTEEFMIRRAKAQKIGQRGILSLMSKAA